MTVGELKRLLRVFPDDMLVITPCDSEVDYAYYSIPEVKGEEFKVWLDGSIGDSRTPHALKPGKATFLVISPSDKIV